MHRWLMFFCFVLAIPCVGIAQQAEPQAATVPRTGNPTIAVQDGVAALLEAKVKAAWSAFKKRDKDRYSEFLTDDFQAVEADGDGERSKARILSEVEHSRYTDYLLQLFQVQQLGSNYAFVTYESTMQFPTSPATRFKRVFIGELWTLRDGDWKMMRYQETSVR